MPIWRLQTTIQADSSFPRDALVMTPHFDDHGVGTDPDGLCEDLADAIVPWMTGSPREVTVRAYDAQGTIPVFPQGEAIRNVGTFGVTNIPRELALCLSFFASNNRPRSRGRLYVPIGLASGVEQPGQRPSATLIAKVAALAPILEGLGGPDVDWSVYSRIDNAARPVTNWFVDDEWDIVRSRGLRGEARTTGTTSEA